MGPMKENHAIIIAAGLIIGVFTLSYLMIPKPAHKPFDPLPTQPQETHPVESFTVELIDISHYEDAIECRVNLRYLISNTGQTTDYISAEIQLLRSDGKDIISDHIYSSIINPGESDIETVTLNIPRSNHYTWNKLRLTSIKNHRNHRTTQPDIPILPTITLTPTTLPCDIRVLTNENAIEAEIIPTPNPC